MAEMNYTKEEINLLDEFAKVALAGLIDLDFVDAANYAYAHAAAMIVKRREILNDKWIKWEGGECPVACGTMVEVKYRDGECSGPLPALENVTGGRDASYAFWKNDLQDNDIVFYRIVKEAR